MQERHQTQVKQRRSRPDVRWRRLALRGAAWGLVLALSSGFIFWTRIVLDVQARKTMLNAHPFDWYADGCLGLALVLLAALLLSRPAPPGVRRKVGKPQNARVNGRKSAKRIRRHRVQ